MSEMKKDMENMSSILLVQIPAQAPAELRELRDYILESLAQGVLALPEDTSLEVLELPPLGGVEAITEGTVPVLPENGETMSQAEEKRTILRRLKDYRAAHGPGCLAAVSVKTARRRDQRISYDVLRHICADGAPKLPMSDWRSIGRALDVLAAKEAADGNSD